MIVRVASELSVVVGSVVDVAVVVGGCGTGHGSGCLKGVKAWEAAWATAPGPLDVSSLAPL